MRHNDVMILLAEYCEGSLPEDRRAEVDRHLAECAACRNDLALIRSAFGALQDEPELGVPEHYFTNLVPKIRQRIERGKTRGGVFAFPAWISNALRPLAAALVLAGVAGLFRLLGPAAPVSPLEELVSQVPATDVDSLVAYFSDANDLLHGSETQQRIVESAPNPALVSDRLAGDVFGAATAEPVAYTDPALLDDQVSDLSEDDVSKVLAELDQAQSLHTSTERP